MHSSLCSLLVLFLSFLSTLRSVAQVNQGQKILRDLSFKTGGSLLFDEADGRMSSRLRTIVTSERGAYRLVYKPSELKSDGKFHTLQLTSLRHGIFLRARTGYYAPPR